MLLTLLQSSGAPPSPNTIAWLKVAGIWKQAVTWIKVAGVWKTSTPYIKVSGVWK